MERKPKAHYLSWKEKFICPKSRAENINNELSLENKKETLEEKDYEECLSCQLQI